MTNFLCGVKVKTMIDKETLAKIKPGARVRVWERIPFEGGAVSGGKEKERGKGERQGSFEGIVIARRHGSEQGANFTVRAVLQEVGVERAYPIYSPLIVKVDILSSPRKVHRAKLYFLRGLSPKRVVEKMKA